jgi:glycosyltransferase involved in cell wall biosynthesis
MKQDAFRDLTLPAKIFDFIAMGTPVVASITQSIQETFREGCFETFTSGDAEDLARAILRLHDDRSSGKKYALRAAEVVRVFSWSVQRHRYVQVVAALARRARRRAS